MSNQQEDLAVTCPACGLLCDDIRIKQQDGHLDVEHKGAR
jgi:formylmethanofuran dehydrogenase subunit B